MIYDYESYIQRTLNSNTRQNPTFICFSLQYLGFQLATSNSLKYYQSNLENLTANAHNKKIDSERLSPVHTSDVMNKEIFFPTHYRMHPYLQYVLYECNHCTLHCNKPSTHAHTCKQTQANKVTFITSDFRIHEYINGLTIKKRKEKRLNKQNVGGGDPANNQTGLTLTQTALLGSLEQLNLRALVSIYLRVSGPVPPCLLLRG